MTARHAFFATTPRAMEPLLVEELKRLGAGEVQETRAGASFTSTLEVAYKVCLWSRLANRVLLPLATFRAETPEQLYEGVRKVEWDKHLAPDGTLAVDFTTGLSKITHTHFGALKVKDAVVDQLRERHGTRPSVDVERPDLRIYAHVFKDEATVGIDLSGESLHRRGYRETGVLAPLKENLAAAILTLGEWPKVASEGGALVDPMCGSGTLPIEAALMAANIAPGLFRSRFGFERWRQHDAAAWEKVVAEAKAARVPDLTKLPPIVGYDRDPSAVRLALRNVEAAGLRGVVHIEKRELADAEQGPAAKVGKGIVVMNPPYGERLGEIEELRPLYGLIGDTLKQKFKGWTGYVLTSSPDLGKAIHLNPARRHVLFNGALECRLFSFPIDVEGVTRRKPKPERPEGAPPEPAAPKPPPAAEPFANRLRKNLKNLGKWAKREGVTCYRVYDGDLPEYAVAVDLYEGFVHVQEYQAPESIDPQKAQKRLRDAMAVLPEVLGVPKKNVFLKVRRKQKGGAQYERFDRTGEFHEVKEYGHTFLVNFTDYLDTGLFLDHRLTRRMVGELAKGRRFLNLFAYTGAATVYAAKGGARSTVTVDLSNTYLDWAGRNFELNGLSQRDTEILRGDCLDFLDQETSKYGLIFLDPPTFSRSKSMEVTFDVQRDHVQLLKKAAALLEKDGVLLFSNNFRRFKMQSELLPELEIEDITAQTIPEDFKRNPRIHNAWRIRRK